MDWDDYAENWDDDPGARAYADAAFDSLKKIASALRVDVSGARVLDFGCGTGLLTERLAAVATSVIAVDRSAGMIAVLAAKVDRLGPARVQAICADVIGSPPPWPDVRFDLVVCSSVCAFVDDYPATAARLVEFLRPGGVFVQWDWELDSTQEEPFGLSRDAIRAGLAGAGLQDVHVDDAFTLELEGKAMTPLVGAGRRP